MPSITLVEVFVPKMGLGPFITTVSIAQTLRFTRFAALGVFGHVALLDTNPFSRYTLRYKFL